MEPRFNMLLLANIWEILGGLLMLLLPLIWGIKQAIDAAKPERNAGDRPAAPPQPAEAEPVAQRAGGQQADPLRGQVEEFLRRSGRVPQPEKARPAEREIEVLVDEETLLQSRPVKQARTVLPRRPMEPVAEVVASPAAAAPAIPKKPARRPVAPPERKTLAQRSLERAAARARKLAAQSPLGHRIIEEDHQFDVQLKAKFDHSVGTLAGSRVAPVEQAPAAPETPAGQIAAMLASPEGVRQAIVINEILRPPSERWQ